MSADAAIKLDGCVCEVDWDCCALFPTLLKDFQTEHLSVFGYLRIE